MVEMGKAVVKTQKLKKWQNLRKILMLSVIFCEFLRFRGLFFQKNWWSKHFLMSKATQQHQNQTFLHQNHLVCTKIYVIKCSFPILLTSKTAKIRDLEKKSPYSKQRRT